MTFQITTHRAMAEGRALRMPVVMGLDTTSYCLTYLRPEAVDD